MAQIEKLLSEAVGELDKLLQARNVAGEPIVQGNVTLIPLVSYGFAFGAGGGTDPKTSGEGGGTGGGGGIKPVAVLVIDDKGARVESVRGTRASMAEALTELAAKLADTRGKGQGGARAHGDDGPE